MSDPVELQDRLVSAIYAALAGHGRWEDFLDEATRLLPGGKATLLHHDTRRGTGGLSLTANFPAALLKDYAAHYARINPWMPHAARRPIGEASSTRSMLAPQELRRTEFHADFLRQLDVSHGIGITLARQSHLNFYLSIIGADCDDATLATRCAVVERLAPHLRHAFALAGTASPTGAVLADGIGQIVLGARGVVRSCNRAAEAILADGDSLGLGHDGTLRCTDKALRERIAAACAAWFDPVAVTQATRLLVSRGLDRLPLAVTVLVPGRAAADAFFRGPETILILEDAERSRPEVARFAGFYGLTPAETRITQSLVDGFSTVETAAGAGVSTETVRSQIKSVLRKTGRRTQADLVALAHQLGRSAVGEG